MRLFPLVPAPVKKSDFTYELPPGLIAQQPLPERSASRMLVVPPAPAAFTDAHVRNLVDHLQPGDLLVFNDTRVIPARLFGAKDSGGRVEILIERLLAENEARAQLGVSKKPKPGGRIVLDAGGEAEVLGRDGEFFHLRFHPSAEHGDDSLEKLLLRAGRLPLPPYIQREPGADDRERYQTVFARETGAVAAPTAGLHFDEALLARLADRGVQFGHVTLHVGAGTFQPMRAESVHEHRMHSEWLNVGAELVDKVRRTRAAGHRVVAVGTTVVRALESAMRDGELQPFAGETQIFIFPGYRIRSVDLLLTNFHLPESTLLMLVSAFAGRERILEAYRHAVQQRYRFFSYGDAMLLHPAKA